MNRLNVILLFCTLILFKLEGCLYNYDPNDDPEADRAIVINFTAKSLSGSLLKSSATPEENLINHIILFGIDKDGYIVQTFPDVNISGQQLTISRNIKSLYAIANPPADIQAEELLTVADLMAMTCNYTSAPQSPFLMSGKAEVDVNNASVFVEFVRGVAKINITGKNNFQIKSVTVTNTPAKGYVFKREPLSPLPERTIYNYSAINSSTYSFYVAENSGLSPTQFVVTGQFEEQQEVHTIELKVEGESVNILRNNNYEVGIVPPEIANPYKDGIKILAIGNSFSINAMNYMFDLLTQLGVDENKIVLATAYYGGASLNYHANNARNDTPNSYDPIFFRKNGICDWTNPKRSLKQMIQLDYWDIITLQQSSTFSFDPSTYNKDLDDLIEYVQKYALNQDFKLGWHMTWSNSYANPSWSGENHGYICNTVQAKILTNSAFDFIIPAGTAIQNARGQFGDSSCTADGSHLNSFGTYIAGAIWVKTITGYDIANLETPYLTPVSENDVTRYNIEGNTFTKIVHSVNAAYANPFVLTPP